MLIMIVNFEYFDMMDMLLETERNINLFNCQEQTLLLMVVGYIYMGVASLLLSRGSNINVMNIRCHNGCG